MRIPKYSKTMKQFSNFILLILTFLTMNNSYSQQNQQQEVRNYIAGGQLVYYTRTSIFNDSTASSITYVNFCANGRYSVNYDGSFYVSGDGGWAGGGSNGNNYGTWDIIPYNGLYYLQITDAYGNTNHYQIDFAKLYQGRWKQGNTQYAFVRNKVVCK